MTGDDRQTSPPRRVDVTGEVADEGGSPGEIEIERDEKRGTGSEADETWRPIDESLREIRRDETEKGKGTT